MPLRVLQFSDIHFSSKLTDQRIYHDDVRQQVLADLASRQPQVPVDAIIIAGDIAFSGKRHEYHLAADWLEKVRAICGCPCGSILTVPGNHDVDRERIKISTKLIHRSLRNSGLPQAASELVALAEAGDACLAEKLADYQTFAASYGCFFSAPSKPSWTRSFVLAPHRTLSFNGLTTVQVCDEADAKEAMLLGAHQYIIPRKAGVEQVAIMHHPIEWLKDRLEATQYLTSRARILIVGHEHVQDLQKITSADGRERLVIASGAMTPENAADPYIYRYNILEFDTSPEGAAPSLSVTIHPRVWSMRHTEFRADYDCLNGGESATITLCCPQYGAPTPGTPNTVVLNDAALQEQKSQLRFIFWRRLEWQARFRVLMSADILPPTPETPLPHDVEEQALRRAEANSKLHTVWESIMAQLPVAEREPNPFNPPT